PGRMNRFQLALVGLLRVPRKTLQLHNPFVHVGEAHRVRIKVREFIRQPDSNIFQVVPIKRRWHFARSPKRSLQKASATKPRARSNSCFLLSDRRYLVAASLSARLIPSHNSYSTPESPPQYPSFRPAPSGSPAATSA